MGDVWESDGVVVETWESSTEPGVTFTTVIREGDIVTGGSGVDLSDAAPQDLGTAASGVSDEASRADHVHDMPTAADVGADPAGTAAGLVDDLSGVSNQSTARSNLGLGTAATADTGTGASNVILGNDSRLTDARTPTSHNHAGGDITSGTVGPARLGSGTANSGTYLRGDQTWATLSHPGLESFSVSGKYIIPGMMSSSLTGTTWPSGTAKPYVAYLPPGTIDGLGFFYKTAGATGYVAYCWMYSVDQYLRAGDFLRSTSALVADQGSNVYRYGAIDPFTTVGGFYAFMVVSIGTGDGPNLRGTIPPTAGMQPFTVWNSTPDVSNGQPTMNQVTGLTATPPASWVFKDNGSPSAQSSGSTPIVIVRYA